MVLVRLGFPINRSGATTLSTTQHDLFRSISNARVILKKIRFNRVYGPIAPLQLFDDVPHMLSLDFGDWLRDNDESNMHDVGNNGNAPPPSAAIDDASHSAIHVLLASTNSHLEINPLCWFEGFISYDMDVDYDFGVLRNIPRHIHATAAMYTMAGARENTVPAMEIVLDIQ